MDQDYELLIEDYKEKKKKIYLRLCCMQELVQKFGLENAEKIKLFDYNPHAMLTESMITIVNEDSLEQSMTVSNLLESFEKEESKECNKNDKK